MGLLRGHILERPGVWKRTPDDGAYTRGVSRIGLDPQQWPEAIFCSSGGYLYRFWLLSNTPGSLVQYHTGGAAVSFNAVTKAFVSSWGDCNAGSYGSLIGLIAAGRTTL